MNPSLFSNSTNSRENQPKFVTLRVWRASVSCECVGHVSLKTPNHYISLWPKEAKATSRKMKYGILPTSMVLGDLKGCVEQDELAEGRVADVRINLYGLDITKIEKTYLEFKRNGLKWSLLADSEFLSWYFRYNNCYNCSGLVFALLEKGGISQLVNTRSLFPIRETAKLGAAAGAGAGMGVGILATSTSSVASSVQGASWGMMLGGPVGAFIGGVMGAALPYAVGGAAVGCTLSVGGRFLVGLRHLSLTPDDIAKLSIAAYYQGKAQGLHNEVQEYNNIDDEWSEFIDQHGGWNKSMIGS